MRRVVMLMECRTIRLLDWMPAPAITPNLILLEEMRARKEKQSKISKRRQQFIIGTSAYGINTLETGAKQRYIEEWHSRIAENAI
jgi:hypothetical protein